VHGYSILMSVLWFPRHINVICYIRFQDYQGCNVHGKRWPLWFNTRLVCRIGVLRKGTKNMMLQTTVLLTVRKTVTRKFISA